MGQFTVVTYKQQTGAVLVKPPDGEEPFSEVRRKQLKNCGFGSILGGADDPRGLVEHIVVMFSVADTDTVQGNQSPGTDLQGGIPADGPVYTYPSFPDMLLYFTSAARVRIGKIFIKSHYYCAGRLK